MLNLKFEGCEFGGKSTFENRVVKDLSFLECNAQSGVLDISNVTPKRVSFLSTDSYNKKKYNKIIVTDITSKEFNMENIVLTSEVDFNVSNKISILSLKRSIFNSKVKLHDKNLDKNERYERLILKDSVFNGNVDFRRLIISSINFENTTFGGVADFWNCEFNMDVIFDKTDFEGNVVFSNSVFHKKAIFLYSNISKTMILRDAQFNGGINLAHMNLKFGSTLSTFNLFIKPFKPDVLEYKRDKENTTISAAEQQETYRILKNDAIQNNNRLGSLEFYANEMKAYKQSIQSQNTISLRKILFIFSLLIIFFFILPNFSSMPTIVGIFLFCLLMLVFVETPIDTLKLLINPFKLIWSKLNKIFIYKIPIPKTNSSDWLILFVQRIFGNFNQSWVGSLTSTLLLAFVLFVGYNYTLDDHIFEFGLDSWNSWGYVISDYFYFLWPGRDFNAITESKGSLKIAFDILSRVLIGIGIYQTIRSFRKLG